MLVLSSGDCQKHRRKSDHARLSELVLAARAMDAEFNIRSPEILGVKITQITQITDWIVAWPSTLQKNLC